MTKGRNHPVYHQFFFVFFMVPMFLECQGFRTHHQLPFHDQSMVWFFSEIFIWFKGNKGNLQTGSHSHMFPFNRFNRLSACNIFPAKKKGKSMEFTSDSKNGRVPGVSSPVFSPFFFGHGGCSSFVKIHLMSLRNKNNFVTCFWKSPSATLSYVEKC